MSAVVPLPADPATQARRRPSGFLRRLFRDKPLGAAGGVLMLAFIVIGVLGPWIAPYGFNEISPADGWLRDVSRRSEASPERALPAWTMPVRWIGRSTQPCWIRERPTAPPLYGEPACSPTARFW